MRRTLLITLLSCGALLLPAGTRAGDDHRGRERHPAGSNVQRARNVRAGGLRGGVPVRPVPITRPVDLVWPPVIIDPGDEEALPMLPPSTGASVEEPPPPERGVAVSLDDCVENSGMAGYNFASRAVVSCEDSAVDIYLSCNGGGGFYFLVPEDTRIKDIGPRNDFRSIRLIKPGGWSQDHGALLTAGHVYVVWAYSGDLYLVKVDALWGKHAMFTWAWHSRLPQENAEKFLKDNAAGPPQTPYYSR